MTDPITAMLGASAIGAGAQIFGAQTGASAQRDAANQATQAQLSMFNTTQANLAPFIGAGPNIQKTLQTMTGTGAGGNPLTSPLTKPFAPTMEQLQQFPGYQFALDQGLKSTQNSYAAKGLGSSGAAMKGAADYAEGLATTTEGQAFNQYQATNKQIFDILFSQAGLSESAAAGQGALSAQVGGQIGSNMIGAGNATAGANVASGNAVAGAATPFTNLALLSQLQNGSNNGITQATGVNGAYPYAQVG